MLVGVVEAVGRVELVGACFRFASGGLGVVVFGCVAWRKGEKAVALAPAPVVGNSAEAIKTEM